MTRYLNVRVLMYLLWSAVGSRQEDTGLEHMSDRFSDIWPLSDVWDCRKKVNGHFIPEKM